MINKCQHWYVGQPALVLWVKENHPIFPQAGSVLEKYGYVTLQGILDGVIQIKPVLRKAHEITYEELLEFASIIRDVDPKAPKEDPTVDEWREIVESLMKSLPDRIDVDTMKEAEVVMGFWFEKGLDLFDFIGQGLAVHKSQIK